MTIKCNEECSNNTNTLLLVWVCKTNPINLIRYLLFQIYERSNWILYYMPCRSRWPWGLGRGSAAAGLLGLRVRIPMTACIFVSCIYYVLGR